MKYKLGCLNKYEQVHTLKFIFLYVFKLFYRHLILSKLINTQSLSLPFPPGFRRSQAL